MKSTSPLDRIRIASPCKASWADMKGDDRARACALCKLTVYNLSALSRAEATQLIQSREGRLCVRLHQRKDGTVITRDCPQGVFALARMRVPALVAGLLALLGAALYGSGTLNPAALTRLAPVQAIAAWFQNSIFLQAAPIQGRQLMGEIAMPPQPPPTATR